MDLNLRSVEGPPDISISPMGAVSVFERIPGEFYTSLASRCLRG